MAKYHINPETGNANLCHAKKRCRFQREGEPPVEHYATKEEARAAFERQQEEEGQLLVEAFKRSGALVLERGENPKSLVDAMVGEQEAAQAVTTRRKLPKRQRPSSEASYGEVLEAYEAAAQEVATFFTDAEGRFVPPIEGGRDSNLSYSPVMLDWEELEPGKSVPRSFSFLGGGIERNAYYDAMTKMVYKVHNENFSPRGEWAGQQEEDALLTQRYEEMAYGQLNEAVLNEKGVEYVPTYFFTVTTEGGSQVPVVAQRYISFGSYEPGLFTDEEKELRNHLLHHYSLHDLHEENILRNKETGKLVLIDCLDPADAALAFEGEDRRSEEQRWWV